MATLIPSFNSCGSKMTGGEKRFAYRLISKLEEDYLCWFDVAVGRPSVHPDFVILNPRRGILVVEIKDWKLDTIKSADKQSFTLITSKGLKAAPNPMEQARQYAQAISDLLEKDPMLCVGDEGRYKGRLCFPYGYGVVLSNIHRRAFENAGLGNVIDAGRVICQDEMFDEVDAETFQRRLWEMFTVRFQTVLSMPQIDRIRWHLFPEIRVGAEQLLLVEEPGRAVSVADTVPDLIKVMDLQQEQLARSLGEGHRVIHGVAGSGKTLILGYRCERLASALLKPILVLCYNVALSAKLAHVIRAKGLDERVTVRTFHSWCRDQLKLYNVAPPPDGDDFFDALVDRVISGVETGQIPRAQYGAVMIDEGHDFRPEWFKLVAQMVDPATNSLLVLYDDAQSIYEPSAKRKFSFSSVGIQAKGRTTVLRLNYRNTAEVLSVAYEFAKDFITPEEADEDGVPLIRPESAGRRGPVPLLNELPTLKAECDYLAKTLIDMNQHGRPWRDMAVVYRARFIGEEVTRCLRARDVPVDWLQEPNGRKAFRPDVDSVKVMTMHSSKGLEFPVVGIPAFGYVPRGESTSLEEAKLLYVAMTRAMDHLVMSCHGNNEFVDRVKHARARAAA